MCLCWQFWVVSLSVQWLKTGWCVVCSFLHTCNAITSAVAKVWMSCVHLCTPAMSLPVQWLKTGWCIVCSSIHICNVITSAMAKGWIMYRVLSIHTCNGITSAMAKGWIMYRVFIGTRRQSHITWHSIVCVGEKASGTVYLLALVSTPASPTSWRRGLFITPHCIEFLHTLGGSCSEDW